MTTIGLTDRTRLYVSEDVETVDREIAASQLWIRLTILMDMGKPKKIEDKQGRIMIHAIAYYY